VPAFQALYNGFDRQLDHQRRYTPKSLKALLERSGFRVIHRQYFNLIAILGWFVSGTLLRKKMISGGQMKLFNAMVPLWKVIDFFFRKIAGISVISVGEKA
jgi:hypothetical protein